MKLMSKLALACFAMAVFVPQAQARDTILNIPLADVLAMPEAQGKLDGSVKFFLSGAATPKVEKTFASDTANPKTNGFNKSDEFACKWAALSALISFQSSAKRYGANAVIDVVSYYKKNEAKSDTTIQCHAGTFVVGLALKGTYAKVQD